MPLIAWLIAVAGPIAIRIVVALGFSVVSFAGVTIAFDSLITLAQSNWSALPASVIALASLSGIPECLGMIAAAYSARLGVWASINATKYVLRA